MVSSHSFNHSKKRYAMKLKIKQVTARASRLTRSAPICAERRATGLPTPIATTAAPARVPPGFRPAQAVHQADGSCAGAGQDRTIVSCGRHIWSNKSDTCVYMTESTKNCSAYKVRASHNRNEKR